VSTVVLFGAATLGCRAFNLVLLDSAFLLPFPGAKSIDEHSQTTAAKFVGVFEFDSHGILPVIAG
jgi:hypothetical protein